MSYGKNVLLVLMLTLGPIAQSHGQEPFRLWQSYLEAYGQTGSDNVGQLQLMAPLWQTQRSLLFADLRGNLGEGKAEGNWGLAFRHFLTDNCIVGAYGFYDLRRTSNDNNFSQATFGAEILGHRWDARMNGYLPETGIKSGGGFNGAVAELINGNIVIGTSAESALPGLDFEVGRFFGSWQSSKMEAALRGYIGAYHFDRADDSASAVSGPRAGLELRLFNLDLLGEGSRVTLTGQVQYDSTRGTQGLGMVSLRVPLGTRILGRTAPKLSPLERRMVDRIVRDIDVVTSATSTTVSEAAINARTGSLITGAAVVQAGGDLPGTSTKLGANSVLVLDGSKGAIATNKTTNVHNGQEVMGGGSKLQVIGASTGAKATFTAPGTRATINAAGATAFTLTNVTKAQIQGLDIATTGAGGAFGISNDGGSNNSFSNVTIATSGIDAAGIFNVSSINNSFSNVIIATKGNGAHGITNFLSQSNSFSNVTIATSGTDTQGIYNNRGINNSFSNVNIATTGLFARGIFIESGSDNSFSNVTIATSAFRAHGIFNESGSDNSFSNVNIATTGFSAHGIFNDRGKNNSFTSINVTKAGGNGIHIDTSSGITLNKSVFTNIGGSVVGLSNADVSGSGNVATTPFSQFLFTAGTNTGSISFTVNGIPKTAP